LLKFFGGSERGWQNRHPAIDSNSWRRF